MGYSNKKCVLASASPRRRELLQQIGITLFDVVVPDVDESVLPNETPESVVARLARAKCDAVNNRVQTDDNIVVIAADTVVVMGGQCLGKPQDYYEFIEMMKRLSGQTHVVLTGVCVIAKTLTESRMMSAVVATKVRMITSDERLWHAYWSSGEPRDKAGGYGIQGRGALLVESIEGSYSNVVGLPLRETCDLLRAVGWDVWSTCLNTNHG